MGAMQKPDPETIARNRRVQGLCRELSQLLILSQTQRRTIDRLLNELEDVTRAAKSRLRLTRAAAAGAPPSRTGPDRSR
jgi:hypothetical protein